MKKSKDTPTPNDPIKCVGENKIINITMRWDDSSFWYDVMANGQGTSSLVGFCFVQRSQSDAF